MNTIDIYILQGLPGSGKTTWAEQQRDNYDKIVSCVPKTSIVHFDENHWGNWMDLFTERVILDGLFLTNQDLIDIIEKVKQYQKYGLKHATFQYTVLHWKEDRETCLFNDGNRRNETSENTIKHATYEYPDVEAIEKATGVTIFIKEMTVQKKPDAMKLIEKEDSIVSHIKGTQLFSDSWCLGGTVRHYDSNWSNCYDSMDSDAVGEFSELAELLEKVAPNLTFLDFRKIQKDFVTAIEYKESDYYSDGTYLKYVCDLTKLFEFLKEKNYI